MKFLWEINESIENLPLSEQIKINRQYYEKNNPSLSEYADINLLYDLEKAAKKILETVKLNKKIIIFGHDDPDGITSTFILSDFLKKLGANNISYYIPNREIEHYGIQKPLIDKILQEKIDLLITVDNGIASYDAVKYLVENNVEVIVTDHHLIPNKIPPAYAVINPKREESKYPDRYLAGVGVAYLLLLKIASLAESDYSQNYLFWTALGTLADRVPLKEANRIILKEAFFNWQNFDDELLFIVDPKFQTYQKSSEKQQLMEFLIPILHNGRDKNGEHKALKMIFENSEQKRKIYDALFLKKTEYENKRKKVDELLTHIPPKIEKFFVFIDSEDRVPFDLTGYFVSDIADKNFIPALILKNKENDVWTCEARSTHGFNLIDAFNHTSNLLLQFGGHAQAAGFTILQKNIAPFIEKFKSYINLHNNTTLTKKSLKIDAVTDCKKINPVSFLSDDLDIFYPFGQSFPYPFILLKNFNHLSDLEKVFKLENFENIDKNKKYDTVIIIKKDMIKLIDFKEIAQ